MSKDTQLACVYTLYLLPSTSPTPSLQVQYKKQLRSHLLNAGGLDKQDFWFCFKLKKSVEFTTSFLQQVQLLLPRASSHKNLR